MKQSERAIIKKNKDWRKKEWLRDFDNWYYISEIETLYLDVSKIHGEWYEFEVQIYSITGWSIAI